MRAIACMAANRTIGDKGKLPWKVSGDLKFFKKMTEGCICIVGSTTYDSLPYLKGRRFYVHTRAVGKYKIGRDPRTGNEIVAENLDPEGKYLPIYSGRDDVWVIGGEWMYDKLLKFCSDLYLTVLTANYDGDVQFPEFEHLFNYKGIVEEAEGYRIIHYTNKHEN